MPKKAEGSREIYQIKVTLLGATPPVWRRLLVPARMTLAKLHSVLQASMGWDGSHLYGYRIRDEQISGPEVGDPFGGTEEPSEADEIELWDVLPRARSKAVYVYDFGDCWEHEVVVEKVMSREPGLSYPVCIAGERRGPPEDSGGAWAFSDLVAALKDPGDERYEEAREWLGEDYDPEAFSAEAVNGKLARLRRYWAKR